MRVERICICICVLLRVFARHLLHNATNPTTWATTNKRSRHNQEIYACKLQAALNCCSKCAGWLLAVGCCCWLLLLLLLLHWLHRNKKQNLTDCCCCSSGICHWSIAMKVTWVTHSVFYRGMGCTQVENISIFCVMKSFNPKVNTHSFTRQKLAAEYYAFGGKFLILHNHCFNLLRK